MVIVFLLGSMRHSSCGLESSHNKKPKVSHSTKNKQVIIIYQINVIKMFDIVSPIVACSPCVLELNRNNRRREIYTSLILPPHIK